LSYISINGNTFAFDRDFKILSNGPGYWGTGTVVRNVVSEKYQLQTTGGEPHGTVGLDGVFDTFTFDALRDENWFGFTIGTYGLSAIVYPPVPVTPYCVDYLSLVPNPDPESCCPPPTLYCVKLLDAVPQTPQTETQCNTVNEGSATFILSQQGQRVFLSSDAVGTISAGFDELGVLTVTTPSGDVNGQNYVAWEDDCKNSDYPVQSIGTSPTPGANEITDLFGNEVGTFSLNLKVVNKYSPYSNEDTYVCTGTSVIPPPTPSTGGYSYYENGESSMMAPINSGSGTGLSASMTILVSVLSAIATTLLIVGIAAIAGYTIVKKSNFSPGLQEGLRI
jgi:hypothetical protein